MRRSRRWLAGAVAVGCGLLATGWSSGAFASGTAPAVTFSPRATPPALHGPGRVFAAGSGDSTGKRVVVYGGQEPGGNTAYGDTWVNRADGTWHAMCGSSVPGATAPCGPGTRDGAGMADARNGVILYGGFDGGIGGSPPLGDTWRWNGATWSRVCTLATCGPGDRALFAMAGNGTTTVMFGGLSQSGVKSDTWVFDGSTWTQACGQSGSPCGPSALGGAALAWDGTHFVLFGGSDLNTGGAVDDTWTFTGHAWTHVCGTSMSKPCGPAARSLSGFAFAANPVDAQQGAILAEGGNIFSDTDQSLIRDAWFFDGAKWSRLVAPWDGPTAIFDSDGSPPPGPNPLLGVLASKPALCEVVYLGTVVTHAGNPPALVDQTFAAGRSPWTASKPSCERAVAPRRPAPVATPTTIASVPPPTVITAPAVVTAPAELPKTGSAALGRNAAVGGALVALGAFLLSLFSLRGRRRTSRFDS